MSTLDHVQKQRALLPVRPKPYEDELLSSWLVRLAKSNGAKLQRFCDCMFGNDRQIWNRDIDRTPPGWLLREMSVSASISLPTIEALTLESYRGRLFRYPLSYGQQRWILPLGMYHRKRLGFGLQYCPRCLADEPEPYFRRRWRVALYTVCAKHECLLLDRCPNCNGPVAFHRRELGRPGVLAPGLLCRCSECGFDLRRAKSREVPVVNEQSLACLRKISAEMESPCLLNGSVCHLHIEFSDVLHQLCKLLVSDKPALRLYHFVLDRIPFPSRDLSRGRFAFESRSIEERHFVLQLALWIMVDLETRLRLAWECGAIRYNHFLKDMKSPPKDFAALVAPLNRLGYPRGRRRT